MKCKIRLGIIGIFFSGCIPVLAQQATSLSELAQKIEILRKEREAKIAAFKVRNHARERFSSDYLLIDVTPGGVPIYKAPLNANAAITTGAAKLHSGELGIRLQGKGMTVGVWDAGRVADHIEFGSRIIFRETITVNGHATHVTGTILAAGLNSAAKGMAPLAQAKTWFFDHDYAEMISQFSPGSDGLILSNHSYGTTTGWFRSGGVWYWAGDTLVSMKEDYRFGLYNEESKMIDEIANLAPYYTIVWAAGNDRAEIGSGEVPPDGNEGTGYDCIIPESTAKNSIVIGSVDQVLAYTDPSSVWMTPYSSWGPTDDGRIKPDLVADGYNVYSTNSVPVNGYNFQGGTSQATANASGSLILLQELHKKLHGNTVMRSSTVKALAIHTAKESGTDPGPDYRFGWGLLDVDSAARTLLNEDGVNVIVDERMLSNDQPITIPLNPVPDKKITVTIAWTDPAAVVPAPALDPTTPALVNDLDIKISDQDGNEILPWIVDPANPSAAATTGNNFRDNIEKIEFDHPEDKLYTLTISHKGTLAAAQYFSLVVTHESKLSTGKTFYWVGGTGVWRDTTHWSLASGGVKAPTLPAPDDIVVIDDNSFGGIDEDTIRLDTAVMIKSLRWMADKPGAIALNGDTITIVNNMTIASDYFRISSPGVLQFKGEGVLNYQAGSLERDTLTFADGDWDVTGNLDVEKIDLLKGHLDLSNRKFSVRELNVSPGATINVTNSKVDSLRSSRVTGNALQSNGAHITIDSTSVFHWDNVVFDGIIMVNDSASLTVTGDNDLDSVLIAGQIFFDGSDNVGYFRADTGSVVLLNPQESLAIDSLVLSGNEEGMAELRSATDENATIVLGEHRKLCYDYIKVSDVDLEGDAVVTAGEHSIVTDSEGWLAVACEDVLFPDFVAYFTCDHGLTFLTDQSTGPITSWEWDFGDPASAENSFTGPDAHHQFSGIGIYDVKLTISNASLEQSYTIPVEVQESIMQHNVITFNSGMLTSTSVAEFYQWYLNGDVIEDAIDWETEFLGPGSYQVLTTIGDCNYMSEPFIVTSLESAEPAYTLYPNPADNQVKIRFSINKPWHKVQFYDAIGQRVLDLMIGENETTLNVEALNDGIYVLNADGRRSKVIVKH